MILKIIFFILLSSSICGKQILELNLHNYAEAQHTHRPLLVLFHKEDRSNMRFLEEFTKIAADNDAIDSQITLGVIDAEAQTELVQQLRITKFPTSYLFVGDDEKYTYQSYWVMENYIKWIRKTFKQSPSNNPYSPSAFFTSYDLLIKKFELFQVTCMLYVEQKDTETLQIYARLAKQIPDFYFAYFYDIEIAQKFNVTQHSLYIHSSVEDRDTYLKSEKHNDYLIHYEGDMKHESEILIFLKIHNKKRFFYVDYYKYGSLVKRDDTYVTIFFVYNSTIAGHEEYAYELKKHKRWSFRKVYIGLIDVVKDASSRARHDFWFKYPDDVPTLVGVRSKGDGENYWKYKCTQDPWQEESIQKCYDDIQNKRIPNFIRNQNFTDDQIYDAKGIRNLNSTTFWDYIADKNEEGMDVLIHFHMVGCKQCEEFYPTLSNVIDTLHHDEENKEKLLFAQIDWQENELENTGVDKFPYFRLYPAYDRKSVNVQDHQKTGEQLLMFLKKNCYNALAGLVEFDL